MECTQFASLQLTFESSVGSISDVYACYLNTHRHPLQAQFGELLLTGH